MEKRNGNLIRINGFRFGVCDETAERYICEKYGARYCITAEPAENANEFVADAEFVRQVEKLYGPVTNIAIAD